MQFSNIDIISHACGALELWWFLLYIVRVSFFVGAHEQTRSIYLDILEKRKK